MGGEEDPAGNGRLRLLAPPIQRLLFRLDGWSQLSKVPGGEVFKCVAPKALSSKWRHLPSSRTTDTRCNLPIAKHPAVSTTIASLPIAEVACKTRVRASRSNNAGVLIIIDANVKTSELLILKPNQAYSHPRPLLSELCSNFNLKTYFLLSHFK
nr:hypothetical protein Iba_chr11fCG10460 [Ipomoea batatas]